MQDLHLQTEQSKSGISEYSDVKELEHSAAERNSIGGGYFKHFKSDITTCECNTKPK